MAANKLGCSVDCLKFFLGFLNLILAVAGICMVGVGISWLADFGLFRDLRSLGVLLTHDVIHAAAIILIVIGTVVVVISSVGLVGSLKESAILLAVYSLLMIVTCLLKLSFGIVALVYRNQAFDKFYTTMVTVVEEKYGHTDYETITESWDNVQKRLQCCGARNGPEDWTESYWRKPKTVNSTTTTTTDPFLEIMGYITEAPGPASVIRMVPNSCCFQDYAVPSSPIDVDKCNSDVINGTIANSEYVFEETCPKALWQFLEDYYIALTASAFTLALVEITVTICACLLHGEVRNKGVYA